MAIIRIKRSTGTNLPSGLTFGELAFVQGRGATANRLYIAGSSGETAWVGAEILNSPVYWSGLTAQTTLATVSAIENRIVAGGGVTFASDITVNISAGKYFGKFTRGDIIPATGKTVKEVVELSLSEVIAPTMILTTTGQSVTFGQTSGSLNITVGYTIKTAGASAAGSTLEFSYGSGTWTTLSSALKDDTKGTDVAYSSVFAHNTWNRSVDAESGGGYATTAFNYRYTVHDTFGASASATGQINPANSTSQLPSVSFSAGITAPTLRTGVFGAPSGTETATFREKGNTFTTVNFVVSRRNVYVPLTNYVLQAQELVNNSLGGWTTIKSEAISGNPGTVTKGLTYSPSASGASLDQLQFRVRVNDQYNNTVGTTTDSATQTVYFDYMVFFGATTNVPTTSDDIRGLSSGIVAGNPAVFGSGGGGTSISNPFTGLVGGANNKFIVALPDSVTPTTIVDSSTNADVSPSFTLSTTLTAVNDRNGSPKNYNVYIMNNTNPYNDSRTHTVTRTGSVSQP
jgi:hypothetical protein